LVYLAGAKVKDDLILLEGCFADGMKIVHFTTVSELIKKLEDIMKILKNGWIWLREYDIN